MKKNRLALFLLLILLAVWVWSGWRPANSENWFLEAHLVLFFVPLLSLFFWYVHLSKTSLVFITLFFILHAIGAHYNYGSVPFGETVGHAFGSSGNVYDRIVHFAFGFLFVYPIREIILRTSATKGFWSYFFPFMIILACSSVYEVMEWLSFANLPPEQGYLFIGGNDPFDAQKDMALAGLGSIILLLGLGFILFFRDRKKFLENFKASMKRKKSESMQESL